MMVSCSFLNMDFDKKEVSSYLDGVPFSVGQKFCPPRPVSMPYALSYRLPEELLSQKYDFSTESKFLAFCKAKKEAEERIAEEKAKDAAIDSCSSNSGDGHPIIPSSTLWDPDSILQPKSQVPNNTTESAPKNGPDKTKQINLSDFEIDTRSPFDYMELQTINDLEELSTVFQGLCNEEKAVPVENNSFGVSSTVETQSLGNVAKSISFPLVQNYGPDGVRVNQDIGIGVNDVSAYNSGAASSKSFSKSSDGYLSYSSPAVSDGKFQLQQQEQSKQNSDNIAPASSAQVPCASSFVNPGFYASDTVPISGSNSMSLRSSKSIPDLSNLWPSTEETIHAARSHTPPAKVDTSHHQYENTPSVSFSNNRDTENSHKGSAVEFLGLPDPYKELNNREQQVVNTITDMGFPQGQVSRAVKHLGTDEKKIIEHLCQIQVLEESGYDPLEAEAALHLHDYDKNEAIRYLDLINQLQDYGFEKDAIKKALVQNKNDRDKVIDALLS